MTVNHYFQSGRSIGSSNEQDLVESLIIECLQIYGFDVFYIPRNPFFQIGKLYVWKLECELMQFSSEIFDTGNTEIDSINDVTLDVRAFGLDTESGLPFELEGNASSTLTVEEYEIENSDPLAQNDKFSSEISIVDFSESNPFGDIRDNQ